MDLEFLKKSINSVNETFESLDLEKIHEICLEIKKSLDNNKILICGNGGSAAQADHFEGELVGRYNKERKALPGISLSLSSSRSTCIGNDYGFNFVFSRAVDALEKPGDVLFCLSTSGNSQNIIEAIKTARNKGIKVISLLGKGGGKILGLSDLSIVVNSDITARIQEAHIFIIHSICEYLEEN